MSFGYSIGDIAGLLQLAKKTFKNCVEARAEYREIASQIKSLYSVLKRLRDEAQKPDSTLFKLDQSITDELMATTNGCKHVLEDLQVLLAKYKGLSNANEAVCTTRKLWHQFLFGSKIEQLGTVREKLITYTSTMSVLLDILQLKAANRVEVRLETGFAEMRQNFDSIRGVVLEMALKARAAHRDGSTISLLSLSTYTEDDKEVWREFRRALVQSGFRSKELDKHKDLIQAYMLRLNQSGLLNHQDSSGQGIPVQQWQPHKSLEAVNSLYNLKLNYGKESEAFEALPPKQGNKIQGRSPEVSIQDAQATQFLLENGFDIYTAEFNVNEAFLWATRKNHGADVVRLLLGEKVDLDVKDSYGETALHWAAGFGNEKVVRLLLEEGANVAAKSVSGLTPLHAAAFGNRKVVRLLLEEGANIAAENFNCLTPLHTAFGNEKVVRLLLEEGANVAAKTSFSLTPLHFAVLGRAWVEIAVLLQAEMRLLVGRADIDLVEEDKSMEERLAVERLLIENGADIEAKADTGMVALHFASMFGQEAGVRVLLENGADVAARTDSGFTSLHFTSAVAKPYELLLLELKQQFDEELRVATRDDSGWMSRSEISATALLCVATMQLHEKGVFDSTKGNKRLTRLPLKVARLLLKGGADVAAKDDDGSTALHLAAAGGHEAMVQLLRTAHERR